LRSLDQLLDPSQTRAIASAIHLAATSFMGADRTLDQVLDEIEALFDAQGLDILDPYRLAHRRSPGRAERGNVLPSSAHRRRHPGAFARPRRFEIAATINRMRSLAIIEGGREVEGKT